MQPWPFFALAEHTPGVPDCTLALVYPEASFRGVRPARRRRQVPGSRGLENGTVNLDYQFFCEFGPGCPVNSADNSLRFGR